MLSCADCGRNPADLSDYYKKGERLAVLHTLEEAAIPEILEKFAAMGLPRLFAPRREHFVRVEKLPTLGTGKLDLRQVKNVALERLGSSHGES